MFINNWIDWDQYNTIYNKDFINKGRRAVKAAKRKYKSLFISLTVGSLGSIKKSKRQ